MTMKKTYVKPKQPRGISYKEHLDVRNCHWVKSLTFDEFNSGFWEEGYTESETLTYYNRVMKFCQRACDASGELTQKYKQGQGKDRGRVYVSGFGCQSSSTICVT